MNNPIGNTFFEGSLGVCNIEFNGVDLGKTIGEISVEVIEDIKDIMFAQNGTQPDDKIPTGVAYEITAKIGEITLARMYELMRGVTLSASNKSALFGRNVYTSGKNTLSKELILTRVDSDGASSTDNFYKCTFPKAFPMVTGPLGAFGADTQRELEVKWYAFYDDTTCCYYYVGYASSLGI